MNFIRKLIDNNTGTSSKNFALVVSVLVSSVSILLLISFLFLDILFSEKNIDLFGLSAVITSIGGTLAAVLYGKVLSERNNN